MINTEDFIKRLQQVIDYYGESAASFAEKIGVQRSSISHILSGRNKPSLDFTLKVLTAFPEVDLYWLFNGKGQFPALPRKDTPKTNTEATTSHSEILSNKTEPHLKQDKSIERIVIFYTDGTFKNFQN